MAKLSESEEERRARYGESFQERRSAGSQSAASIVLQELFDIYRPSSVLDIGCGKGEWLNVVSRCGIDDIRGYEGTWVDEASFHVDPRLIQRADFSEGMVVDRVFELVICLEVAEHISERHADAFLATVTRFGNAILFSAAVPGQGGVSHINEQWPEYWIHKFSSKGFESFDCIRPLIWRNEAVPWWYRQNILLFLSSEEVRYRSAITSSKLSSFDGMNVVHPRNFEAKVCQLAHATKKMLTPTSRETYGYVKRWAIHRVRTFLGED